MKRFLCCLICTVLICSFTGCDSRNTPVISGNYYAVGDYEEWLTPYLWLDTNNNRFSFGAGAVISYAESGTYEFVDGKLVATSQSTTFTFEITDAKTLVLIDDSDNAYFNIPVGTQFVYSEDLQSGVS